MCIYIYIYIYIYITYIERHTNREMEIILKVKSYREKKNREEETR